MPDEWIAGLPPPLDNPDPVDQLYIHAARDWIERNTTFRFAEYIEADPPVALPGGVVLFILKYRKAMDSPAAMGVTGQSLAGMSQSFSGAGAQGLLRDLAAELLGEWYSPCTFVAAESGWT